MNYYSQNFDQIDFRKQPELYKVGKGEQGVLSVEPYKSEILPFWRFKTPEIAQTSDKEGAVQPTEVPPYKDPRNQHHFVVTKTKKVLPLELDEEKARSAEVFYEKYKIAKENKKYVEMKKSWQERYG